MRRFVIWGAVYTTLAMFAQSSAMAALSWPYSCDWKDDRAGCFGNFHDGLARVPTGDIAAKWPVFGYMDKTGVMIIAPQFDNARDFANGIAAVVRDGQWGYIDTHGDWVIPPAYDEANPFNENNVAMVGKGERLSLIDRNGEVVKTLPLGTRYNAPSNQAQLGIFPVESPRAPVVWQAESGDTLELPDQAMDVAVSSAVKDGIFVKVRTSQYQGLWGLYGKNGDWIIPPKKLNTINEPVTDGALIAVKGKTSWRLYDMQGKQLAERDYSLMKVLMPGTWSAQGPDNRTVIVNDRADEVQTIDQQHGYPRLTDDSLVIFLVEGGMVLVQGNGKTIPVDVPGVDDTSLDGGVIWATDESDDVLAIVDRSGKSLIDEDVAKKLASYSVYKFSYPDGYVPSEDEPLPLAALSPDDYTQPPAILTRSGRIVSDPSWAELPEQSGVVAPVIVKTREDRFGAIDADGHWVIQPDYQQLYPFSGTYTLGKAVDADRGVAIDRQGKRYPVRPYIYQNAYAVRGDMLVYSERSSGFGARLGLWDITQQSVVGTPRFSDIDDFVGGYAPASKHDSDGQTRWGIIDRGGQWVIDPIHTGYSAPERLAPGIYQIEHPSKKPESSDRVYQLVSASQGQALTADLQDKPEAAGEGRYLVQPVTGGVQLIDDAGHALATVHGHAKDATSAGGWVSLAFDNGYGALASDGSWAVQPVYQSTLEFVAPLMVARAYNGVGYDLVDSHGKVLPMRYAMVEPIPGMKRYARTIEDEQASVMLDSNGQEIARIKGRYAIDTNAAGNGLVAYEDDDTKLNGFMNADGQRVIGPFFDSLQPIHDDRAAFQRKKISGDLYGFISRDGHLVIPAAFTQTTGFSEGQALVAKSDGDLYVIDRQGQPTLRFGVLCERMVVMDAKGGLRWPNKSDVDDTCIKTDDSAEDKDSH